jgi:hypothetical protein
MFSLKRYGGETVRERVCHSNDMAAKFSLTRHGGDVFTHSVRGRGCHSNGTGARFALKRYGDEVFTQTVWGGNLRLFMRNSWGMRGDFSLGIRSSEEVQLQAAQIDTHVKSLTKPRFPFYVRTGSLLRAFLVTFSLPFLVLFFEGFLA